MMFNQAEVDENFDIMKWVSPGGIWELGYYRVMYGVRVRFGRAGEGYVLLDLCAGADRALQDVLLRYTMIILMPIAEDSTDRQITEAFPCVHSQIKPIDKDVCWQQMQERAASTLQDLKSGKLTAK